MFNIALATLDELPEIVAIYNSTIASRQVTADLQSVSVMQRQTWFEAHQRVNRPLYVMKEVSGSIVAWGSFSDYYPRAAYERTAEISLYVAQNQRGKGVGQWLLYEMMQRAPTLGIHKIVAVIFAHNTPSVALFRKNGFALWCMLPEVCDLDGQLANIVILGATV